MACSLKGSLDYHLGDEVCCGVKQSEQMFTRQKDQWTDRIRKFNIILNNLSWVGLKCMTPHYTKLSKIADREFTTLCTSVIFNRSTLLCNRLSIIQRAYLTDQIRDVSDHGSIRSVARAKLRSDWAKYLDWTVISHTSNSITEICPSFCFALKCSLIVCDSMRMLWCDFNLSACV